MGNIEPLRRAVDVSAAGEETRAAAGAFVSLHGTTEAATPADIEPRDDVLERMGFSVGNLSLLLPPNSGREVIPAPPVSRLPNTAAWLLGLANVRGNLVPVVDTAAALGATREVGKPPPYALIFGHADAAIALLIDGLPRLLSIDVSQRSVDGVTTPALLEGGGAIAAYDHNGRTWLDLDLMYLLDVLAQTIAL
jgi:chemotaxis signal transduction protein